MAEFLAVLGLLIVAFCGYAFCSQFKPHQYRESCKCVDCLTKRGDL